MRTAVMITTCDNCGSDIRPKDVFKTVAIPQAHGHLALIYSCPSCEKKGKAAASAELWEQHQQREEEFEHANNAVIAEARIDIASIDSVQDIVEEWRSYPPPLREGVNGCNCKDCKEKKYRG